MTLKIKLGLIVFCCFFLFTQCGKLQQTPYEYQIVHLKQLVEIETQTNALGQSEITHNPISTVPFSFKIKTSVDLKLRIDQIDSMKLEALTIDLDSTEPNFTVSVFDSLTVKLADVFSIETVLIAKTLTAQGGNQKQLTLVPVPLKNNLFLLSDIFNLTVKGSPTKFYDDSKKHKMYLNFYVRVYARPFLKE